MPQDPPAASVVIPSRRGAHRLPELLEALARQDTQDAWEVIIVLDEDVDGSRELVDEYADRLPLRVIERMRSEGVAAALRDGYDAARGEVVIRCDDDLTPRVDFVSRHLAWHHSRPPGSASVGVIALTRDVFPDSVYADAYGRPANARLRAAAYARPAAQRWMHWAACNSVPKAAYDAVGGFDATMTYREDSELGLRLAQYGVEMVVDPALEIEHRGPATSTADRAARAFISGASTREFDKRHPEEATAQSPRVGVWGWLVSLASTRLQTQEDAQALGHRVDTVLRWAPQFARGKLIAWAVESAAESGRQHCSTAG